MSYPLKPCPPIRRLRARHVLTLLLLGLAACGEAKTPTETPDVPVATTLALSATSLSFSSLDDTQQLSATVRDQNGAIMNGASVTWVSSASNVASVSPTGFVTAVADGSATITATTAGVSGMSFITVQQRVATVVVTPSTATIVPGGTLRFSPVARDARGNAVPGKSFEWSSSNEGVALVDSEGLVTAINLGSVMISAAADAATGNADVDVAEVWLLSVDQCQIAGSRQEAFATNDVYLRPVGELRAILIFVDFDDAPASESIDELYDQLVPDAVAWYEEVSGGVATFRAQATERWYRMPKRSPDYGAADGWTGEENHAYITDAVLAADPDVDYASIDLVYVVSSANAAIFTVGLILFPGWEIPVDGTVVRHGATLGTDFRDAPPNTSRGGWIIHETGHTFGLPDLWDASAPTWDEGQAPIGIWDIMGWGFLTPHFLTWHKWKIGWLSDAAVDCLDGGQLEKTLAATTASDGTKAIIIPTSPSTAYVIEARKRVGFDSRLCEGGVLVYTVDGNVRSGEALLRLRAAQEDTDPSKAHGYNCGPRYNAAFNTAEGEVSTFEDPQVGLRVQVMEAVADGFRVRVSLSPR